MDDPVPDDPMPVLDDSAPTEADAIEDEGTEPRTLLDRLRGTGVGVEDSNIVGDAGPTDVAPGADPPLPPLEEPLPPEEPFE